MGRMAGQCMVGVLVGSVVGWVDVLVGGWIHGGVD